MPEKSTFFRLQVYGKTKISQIEVYEWVGGISVISVFKRPKWVNRCILWFRKSQEEEEEEEEIKRDTKFLTRDRKRGLPFVHRRYTKGVPCLLEMVYNRVRSWN